MFALISILYSFFTDFLKELLKLVFYFFSTENSRFDTAENKNSPKADIYSRCVPNSWQNFSSFLSYLFIL